MDKLLVISANNTQVDVDVIRYFNLNNNKYLVYSLNEVDEQNYVKLYAVKVNENEGLIGSNIVDENEWNIVKEKIKEIIMGNKAGNLNVEDLDYRMLTNLRINDYRVFKLSLEFTELLKANKKVFDQVVNPIPEEQPNITPEPVLPPENPTTSTNEPEMDYQALYLAEKTNNERLIKEIEELKNKINSIKDAINNLI
ncbi:MAG: DUF1292 domain-containing protein [Mollicutes bacterium]|nr:DUF1292 domain-containing protein [Mollicutes bacterium]